MAGPSSDGVSAPAQLAPLPDTAGFCPLGHGALSAHAIHVAGWRTLLRGSCPQCGHTFVQDLPAGHGLVYPCSLDLDTGDVYATPPTEWFSAPLRGYYERPDADPVEVTVRGGAPRDRPAVLLNCLDVVYGHALLKLLNAGRHRDEHTIALVPAALAGLVPAHVDEAWELGAGFGRLGSWLLDLDSWVAGRLAEFTAGVRLSPAFPHPHPSTYAVAEHLGDVEPRRNGSPSIVLALRDDRRWGAGTRAQARNVARFAARVARTYPDAGFTAVGLGGAGRMPSIVEDLRAQTADPERERRWLAAMAGADLAIGVHGSNLLLPSGLAGATIELVPRERYANYLQATLVSEDDPLTALMTHRALYGDRELGDVDGDTAGAVAANLLAELPRFRRVMAGELAGVAPGDGAPAADAMAPAPADPDLAPGPLVRAAPVVRRGATRAAGMARTAGLLARRQVARARARRRIPPVVMTDSRGSRLELVDSQEVAAFIEHSGHFEGREIDLVARFLHPGDTAFDIGANIGHFTAAMARAVAPSGAVHAFEPLASNRERLARTIELNGLEGAQVVPAAVGAREGQITITDYGVGYGSWATTRPRDQDPRGGAGAPAVERQVPVVALDAYCAEQGIDHVAVAKVDVEGAELDVLEGAAGMLAADAVEMLLVEVSDNTTPAGRTARELVELLATPPLRAYVLEGGRLRAFRAAGRLDFAGVVALNAAGRARLGL